MAKAFSRDVGEQDCLKIPHKEFAAIQINVGVTLIVLFARTKICCCNIRCVTEQFEYPCLYASILFLYPIICEV